MKGKTHPLSPHLLPWLLLLGLAWAMTPAGTIIRNQAAAQVGNERYLSNVVETRVLPLCVPLLSPDGTPQAPGQRASGNPGGRVYLPYLLKNGGNASFSLGLSYALASPLGPSGVRFFHDLNENGQLDPGEPEAYAFTLEAGGQARLLMEVTLPQDLGEIRLTPVATCPDGNRDDANYAAIEVRRGPILALEKSATPSRILPGEEVTFRLVVRNLGEGAASGVQVTDLLQDLPGLTYRPGSASAPKGRISYYDGASWREAEPSQQVLGLRLEVDLSPGEEAYLEFRMRVAEGAAPGLRQNLGEATGPGGPARSGAFLEVLPRYAHHLGPRGNPKALPGGEGSPDDGQTLSRLLPGREACFAHTLLNEGNVPDAYDLTLEGLPQGATYAFRTLANTPLTPPLSLGPGEALDFQLCLTVPNPGPGFTVVLGAVSRATGRVNRTRDTVGEVLDPRTSIPLQKEVTPEGTVAVGTLLTYTLRVENRFGPLTGVQIRDSLPPELELVEAPGGRLEGGVLVFEVGDLAEGEARTFTFKARVRQEVPDDTLIRNRFFLHAQGLSTPLESNLVETPVFSTSLLLSKSVEPKEVAPGDRLVYRLELVNPSRVPLLVRLEDTPPPGTAYIPGSGRLCEGGERSPVVEGNRLLWEGIPLEGGGRLCLTYALRVLPETPRELLNVARAQGVSAAGAATASGRATALARVEPQGFTVALLAGRVYLDLDEDRLYTPGRDLPLPGARVVLPNGWQTLTDAEGRYAFRDLTPGVWTVTLDRLSAPFPPLKGPAHLGEGYTQRVLVQGLAVADFPLKAPRGGVMVERTAILEFGPLRVEKRLVRLEGRLQVVLHLHSQSPLEDLTLRDPLPGGGEKTFHFPSFQGEKTLSYETQEGILTDPEVRWRYP